MKREKVVRKYIRHVLKKGRPPASVYSFAKKLEINEKEFYEKFASFEALESSIWAGVVRNTAHELEKGDDWDGFNAQQRLLSFHYRLCDHVLENRSFFLARFPRMNRGGSPSCGLDEMRHEFQKFADHVLATGRETGEVACRGALTRSYPLGLFGHLLSVIEFNLSDTSEGFERTDAYIEKSIRLAFDVMGTQAVDSAFDLFRFLSGRSRGQQ